jgi:5'-3' exonuclease
VSAGASSSLFLIDATFELFRTYSVLPSERAPDGREVGAIRGLVASMLVLLRESAPTYVAAATDHIIESFRNRLFAGYKTGDGIPPDLWAQFPLAEEALEALGIVVWPMVEFEADDALATAAARFGGAVDQVVILSPDKDLAQCVDNNRVVLRDRIRRITYDEPAIRTRFGIPPSSIPDYLALVGDRADGIPGLPGWGAKSAAALLAVYGSIEAIPDDAGEWSIAVLRGRERLSASLASRRTDALLYKTLATLRRDVPLREKLVDLTWRGVPRERYETFCKRLGLLDLINRPTQWAAE